MLKKVITLSMIAMFMLVAVACGGGNATPSDTPAPTPNNEQPARAPKELSGNIDIAGSTSVQPIAEELAMLFMEENRGVRINVSGGGSGAGIEAAGNGAADIGMSSRALKQEEFDKFVGIKDITICQDGISVIVHPNSPMKDITIEQVKAIYAGEVTNWKEVGGPDVAITVVTREEGSGTRGAFEEIVLGKTPMTQKVTVQSSTGAVRTAVAADVNAIGYVSMGSMSDDVRALVVDGAEATAANVQNGNYKISRPFLFLVEGEMDEVSQAFVDYILSADGQEIIAKEGFISVN